MPHATTPQRAEDASARRKRVDGFVSADAYEGYSPRVGRTFQRFVNRAADALGVEVTGLGHIPDGRALLVTNHAFGFDASFLMAHIEARTGRRVWVLGEHLWWRVPVVRRLAQAVGVVDGTPENADRLLSADELVLVLPGGMREALKPRELRYRLLWGDRYGFVRAALRNGAPMIPVASLGADDVFDLVGDAFARARKLRLPFPLPRPARLIPVPRLTRLRYVIGEPIPAVPPSPDMALAERRLRREVEGALHEMFEERLARRAGFARRAARRSREGSS